MKKANVLGTEYTIKTGTAEEFKLLEKADGYTDVTTKEIVLQDTKKYEGEQETIKDLDRYIRRVLRHELIHAFLHESGLDSSSTNGWATCEEIVDWIALQFPKMMKVFEHAGCMEGDGMNGEAS